MTVRYLILNTEYLEFLAWLYACHPGLEEKPYEEQLRACNESLFGVADFYSGNLRKVGQEAYDIHPSNEFMQRAWARQQGVGLEEPAGVRERKRGALRHARRLAAQTPLLHLKPLFLPILRALDRRSSSWFYEILSRQIKHYKPDVLINQDMLQISSAFLREMKPYVRLLVGQHAATQPGNAREYGGYDLVISSFPPTVEYFRQNGMPAELNRLGFEPKVLFSLPAKTQTFDVTFVGSFQRVHSSRRTFLEALCERLEQPYSLNIWAPTIESLPSRSPLRRHYRGQVWGREMYEVLNCSRITLNHHGDVLPYANNMRLFEATGVGTLLVTDWKENLNEMFVTGKEVVAYRTPDECADLIRHYLTHEDERQAIARVGQARTLREHTYYQRMQELAGFVGKLL